MGLWYWELMSHPDPAVLPVGTLHSLERFWVSRRIFIYSYHNTFVFSLRRPFVHGLFVSWGATGWRFVINSRANIHVTIDCSTVLPLVLGVVPKQKPQLMGLWYWELMSHPDPAVLPVGTLHSLERFWVSRRIFIYSYHNTFVFSLRRPFVHGLFVSWGATGWRFVINFLPKHLRHNWLFNSLTSGVGNCYQTETAINGSVVLGADESPWPCSTPSWYTPLSWTILSEQKNLHLFLSQHICVFSKTSVRAWFVC